MIEESVHFINYSINDGLPSSETYDVFQDSKGYMWIGTDNGVVRYDGANFEVFTTLDGLTDNTVFKIQEDHKGRIWFITYNRKLCYFENEEFYPYQFNIELNLATQESYVGYTISRFEIDNLDQIKLTLTDFSTITVDSVGNVKLRKVGPHNYSKIQKRFVESKNIKSLITSSKPILSDYDTQEKLRVKTDNFNVIHAYKIDTLIYLGTKNGLTIAGSNSALIYKNILSDQYVTGLTIDNEGGIWCSTLFNGVFYVPNFEISLFKLSRGKSKNHVHGIIPYESDLIFCYNKDGKYYRFDSTLLYLNSYNEIVDFRKIPFQKLDKGIKLENPIFFKDVFSSATSLIAINSNSFLFSGGFVKLLVVENTVTDFNMISTPDQSQHNPRYDFTGRKWTLCESGYFSFDKKNNPIYNKTLAPFPNKILKLFKDLNNQIWVGTPNGLFEFDNKTKAISKVQSDLPFENFRIQDIIQTQDSAIIIGTKAHGLFIWKNNVVTNITLDSGLLSNTINMLIFDEETNKIWVATNNGVSTLSQINNGSWKPISVITKYDALTSVDIRQIAIHKGFILMANNTGVSKVSLNQLNKKLPPPYMYLRGLKVNNVVMPINEPLLSFPYDSNTVKLSFQAIAFKSQNEIEYFYKIPPIQNDWQKTKSNEVILPALPPGDYEFIVKAKNAQEVESETQNIKFSILPAFWMTYWFQALALLVLIYLLYRIIRKVFERYKEQANFERKLKQMQVVSLQSKMNPHFIFNSLNSIQNFILKNEKDQASSYLMEFSKLIRKTLQNSDSPYVCLNDELETLNMYVDLEKRRLRNEFEYIVEIDDAIDVNNCEIPSLLIQPYLENSIWHGNIHKVANGIVRLRINLDNQQLNFEIMDNGIGIRASQKSKVLTESFQHTSLANSITDNRVKILSELNQDLSKVIICDAFKRSTANPNVGTRVTFSIPYIVKSKS